MVDTIGKMLDICGMMHVMACIYNHGWDPVVIIIVSNVHSATFNKAASYLQASLINYINFEPGSFYLTPKKGRNVETAFEDTMEDKELQLPFVNPLTPDNFNVK